MYKHPFILKQHTPLIHHLGKETWSGLQTKAVIPRLNFFIAERITNQKGNGAKTAFIEKFKEVCTKSNEPKWNAGSCRDCKIKGCNYKGWFRNTKEIESLAFNYDLTFDSKVDMASSYKAKVMMQNRAHVLFENRQIKGFITCTSGLMDHIKQNLTDFFILTGFGYNSSKGFGCFTLAETQQEQIIEVIKENFNHIDQVCFSYNITAEEIRKRVSQEISSTMKKSEIRNIPSNLSAADQKQQKRSIQEKFEGALLSKELEFGPSKEMIQCTQQLILKDGSDTLSEVPKDVYQNIVNNHIKNLYYRKVSEIITDHWKWIKSGSRFPYHKSLLWRYFCDRHGNINGWDKRFVKEALRETTPTVFNQLKKQDDRAMRFEDNERPRPVTFEFSRALLGLAEHYTYALSTRINGEQRIKITVHPENDEIERIPSPVRFKVFYDRIYLIVDSVNPSINHATFTFNYEGQKLKYRDIDKIGISIPPTGLRDCFEKILSETESFESGHPLCDKYEPIK